MNSCIIGVQKSATTALAEKVSDSGWKNFDLALKDVHFLSENFDSNDLEKLKKDFLKNSLQNSAFYIAVNYWRDLSVLKLLVESNFNLILVLRNPIERTISAYNYFKKVGVLNESLEHYCQKYIDGGYDEQNIFSNSFYSKTLKSYPKEVSERLHILYYEDMIANPSLFFCQFESASSFTFDDYSLNKVNKAGNHPYLLETFYQSRIFKSLSKFFRRVLPRTLIKRLYFIKRDSILIKSKRPDEKLMVLLKDIFENELVQYVSRKY